LGAETDLTVADQRWLSPLPLWAGILAGPIAWASDLGASYALVQWTCASQRVGVLHLISLLALMLTMGGAVMSWMALQHTDHLATDAGQPRARARFMAVLGLSINALFAAAIIAGAIPRWVLNACQ
jgi:hypothetical protein